MERKKYNLEQTDSLGPLKLYIIRDIVKYREDDRDEKENIYITYFADDYNL